MALGIVQTGYKSSLYLYAAGKTSDLECSYAELLAELTTELELALEGNMEETVKDSEEGEDTPSEDGQSESYSARKKEWEEQLDQATVVEAMLRQALENGLGQHKEEEKTPQKQKEEETDNDFSLDGIPIGIEGKSKSSAMSADFAGSSIFLSTNSGSGAEYLGLSGGADSKVKRLALQKMLNLPEHLSANALLDVLNLLYSKEEIYRMVDTL